MAATSYNYTKEIHSSRLEQEIRDSAIVTALDYINVVGADAVTIYFKDELSLEDEDILDSLVDNHVPTPLDADPKDVVVVAGPTPPPFASKVLPDGKKLFRRKHGVSETVNANSTGTIELVVPYSLAKINKIEIVNCSVGDLASLKVYDTPQGTLSGVPDLMLNQFGFDVYLPDGMYSDESNYDADLIQYMKIELTYTNNGESAKEIGMNVTLHQLV